MLADAIDADPATLARRTRHIASELFCDRRSGANAAERITAGKAVSDDLGQHAQVLATTPDVKPQEPLSERIERLHFREDPHVDGSLDYRLRVGANTKRDAIRSLERIGSAARITEDAMRLAGRSRDRECTSISVVRDP